MEHDKMSRKKLVQISLVLDFPIMIESIQYLVYRMTNNFKYVIIYISKFSKKLLDKI